MRQDITDTAAFSVWARIQDGHPLTMSLCHQVIAELGSTARAHRVYRQVRQCSGRRTLIGPGGSAGADQFSDKTIESSSTSGMAAI